jgi:hypothetical protein
MQEILFKTRTSSFWQLHKICNVLDAASLNGGHSINFMAFAHEDNDLHPRGINGS